MSLQFNKSGSLPAEAGCETRERIVLLLALLHNNDMATNIRRRTSRYGGRRSATGATPSDFSLDPVIFRLT